MLNALLACLLTCMLAACASTHGLAPQGRLTAADELQATRSLADVRLAEAAWPASDWWKGFADPQLDRLESEALAGSPTLQLARSRLQAAQARAGVATAALSPQIDANLSSTRQRFSEHGIVPEPLAGSWQTPSRLALDFSYEFDFWGKNHAALAAALNQAEASKVDAFAARLVLSVAVARGYVQLARFYDQIDVATDTLAQQQQIHDLTRQRVDAGLDTRVELKQAEAALPATREHIAALHEALATTRNQLAALLGQGPDRALAITRPKLAGGGDAPALPSRLNADLLGRRPDVVASRWRVEAAAKDIDVAKAQFYPDIDLLAFVGLQSIGLPQFLKAGSGIAGIGPAITLPLFDGERLRSNLAGADADYDSAVAQYNQTLVAALRDLADQLAAMHSVAAQSAQQRRAIGAASEAYDLSLMRFRDGVGTYLSVLSAQAQVLAQQRLQADLRARELDNRINLVRALGGGFEDSHESVAAAPSRNAS